MAHESAYILVFTLAPGEGCESYAFDLGLFVCMSVQALNSKTITLSLIDLIFYTL